MANEDNFLRLDPNNYDSEWQYAVENNFFSLKEIAHLFKKGLISVDDYIYAVDYLS